MLTLKLIGSFLAKSLNDLKLIRFRTF